MAKHPKKTDDVAVETLTASEAAAVVVETVAAESAPVAPAAPVKMVLSTISSQASLLEANQVAAALNSSAEAKRLRMHDAIKKTIDLQLAQESKG